MNNKNVSIENELIDYIKNILPESKQQINISSDTDLKNELYLDSFTFAELYFYIQDKYNVNLVGQKIDKYTPNVLASLIVKNM